MKVLCALVFLTAILNITGELHISEDDYAILPPIYSIDPYSNCADEKKIFCRLRLELEPLNVTNPSEVWKLIEKTKKSRRHYDHGNLYRAICVNQSGADDNRKVSKIYSEKYRSKGLKAKATDLDCRNDKHELNAFDMMIVVLLLYTSLWLLLGFYHYMVEGNRNVYITMFSGYYICRELVKKYKQDDGDKLKHIQGIRFYTTMLVIMFHTLCSFLGTYIANTNYLEDIPLNFFRHSLQTFMAFLVQIFFLISAWLLSYNTFTIFRCDKNINGVKYGFVTLINRYLRLIPPLVVVLGASCSGWVWDIFSGPLQKQFADPEYERCVKNWWINLLFLNNHYRHKEMCHFHTWYLAADTQLYFLSLILLIVTIKLERHKFLFLTLCLLSAVVIQSAVAYLYNLDFIFRFGPKYTAIRSYLLSPEFVALYTSTYANMATYILGLIFGYIYFLWENEHIFNNNIKVVAWWIISLGLPSLVVVVSNYQYDRVTSAILAGVVKPIFALGVGIGIFGMSQNIGGFLRKLCEWKPAVFLGNFTYSTYVTHFALVFSRAPLTTSPLYVSDYVLFTSFVRDLVISFVFGILMYILIEFPFSQLQNRIIYKFSVNNYKSKNKTN